MPYYEEGYVIVDKYFNRIKIKNPKYLAVHYLKSSTAQHHILIIIKSNEIEEYVSTIPERKDELLKLKEKYDLLLKKLNNIWDSMLEKPKTITKEERKLYAQRVFNTCKQNNIELNKENFVVERF